jgi:hypothetical protein
MANKTNKATSRAGAKKTHRRRPHMKKRQTKAMRQKKDKMYKRMNSALFSGVVST